MSDFTRTTTGRVITWLAFPTFLLLLCAAAYAVFIPWLGFYWDDYPMVWIATTMGGEGLERYFATNRPVWGLVYRLTTPLLGSSPVTWQGFALLLRWLSGLAFWRLIHLIWPERKTFAAWAAVLFVIYPGFSQQSIAFLYSHFYIILILFLVSLSLSVLALRRPRQFWPLSAAALVTSAFQLLAMEYFFLLELLRPLLMWLVMKETVPNWRQRLGRALTIWLPYLVIFIAVMVWRSLFFGFHTYQPTLTSRLKEEPVQASLQLAQTAISDVWLTTAGAWQRALQQPAVAEVGERNLQRYWLIVGAGAAASGLYLLLIQPRLHKERLERRWLWQPLLVGGLGLFIAGGPFWLTDLQIGLVFPNDRFTLSFMLGACLVTAAVFQLLPWPNYSGAALLAVGLGFAIGMHFQEGIIYRRDWSVQRAFFWQLYWRAPAVQPGTTFLANELPLDHYTDNSLSAPLNWIYDPNNDPQRMNYILFYPTLRRKTESWMVTQPQNQAIERDYLAATFYGSTSQVVTLYFEPPGCLRVLDPEIEHLNWMVPMHLRETLDLASTGPILAEPAQGMVEPVLPQRLFGSEPAPNWCYYFEKADLARQLQDWDQVVSLAEQAFSSGDYPNDPIERLPFIEGYAHTGRWQQALELSRETGAITPAMRPVLCALWERIERETPYSEEQQGVLESITTENNCPSTSKP